MPEPKSSPFVRRLSVAAPTALAVVLGLGWVAREAAFAAEKSRKVASQTVTLDQVKMSPAAYQGRKSGDIGVYIEGDTPGSTNFVTGRFRFNMSIQRPNNFSPFR